MKHGAFQHRRSVATVSGVIVCKKRSLKYLLVDRFIHGQAPSDIRVVPMQVWSSHSVKLLRRTTKLYPAYTEWSKVW